MIAAVKIAPALKRKKKYINFLFTTHDHEDWGKLQVKVQTDAWWPDKFLLETWTLKIQERGRMAEYGRFYDNSMNTNICSFIERNRANAICLPNLHPKVLVSFPVIAVVSGLTLQWDSSLHYYRPDRTTHCDLQLLLLQCHLDHNHSWTLSISLSPALSLFYIHTLLVHASFA